MIEVIATFTASQTDILSGTDLANIPRDGVVEVYVAASQNDWTQTITGPNNEPIIRSQKVPQRTNGMVIVSDDTPKVFFAPQGGHFIIAVTVVTAGTGNVVVRFYDLEEAAS